jgi:uncharacterized radical SAM superfamily Fe-S cluster-containing enzyme
MTTFTDTFCLRPFTDLVFDSDKVKPCCYFLSKYNKKYDKIENANIEVRDYIKQNKWHAGCENCRKTEQDGNTKSHRLNFKQDYDDFDYKLFLENNFVLKNLEIRVDNNCNIACVTCFSHSSTRWSAELKRMNEFDPSKNKINTDIDTLLTYEIWKNVEKLTLYGGEPMYNKKVEKILTYAVENNFSKNIDVHFFSNGTLFNEKIISKFEKFKSVAIGFSVDGVHERLHVIRWPAIWEDIVKNFNKLKNIWNVHLYIIYTYSLLNACNTKEDLEVLRNIFKCPVVPNLVINPSYYAPRHLPEYTKLRLIEHLKTEPFFEYLIAELQQIGNIKELKYGLQQLVNLDRYRNTDSSILFPPEVWAISDK